MINTFNEIAEELKKISKGSIAVVEAGDSEVIESLKLVEDYIEPVLIGNEEKIKKLMKELDLKHAQVIPSESPQRSAEIACTLAAERKVGSLMKGKISTGLLMKEILNKKYGIMKGDLLSHAFLAEDQGTLRIITDGGIVIKPSLQEKIQIMKNASRLAEALGWKKTVAAVIAAVELVNPSMPASIEAGALATMAERGQFGDMTVEGPLAFDNAIRKEAAEHKGIKAEGAGEARILLVPDLETGNILGKSMSFIAKYKNAGIVLGAAMPLVLTSRADSAESKYHSLLIARYMAHFAEQNNA
jgi:phosphate butyryltransferase